LRLAGQYFDLESGWNHNGFRNYLPDLGRYAKPDPLAMQGSASYFNPNSGRFFGDAPTGFARGADLYAYAEDNPINLDAPLGLQEKSNDLWNTGNPFAVARARLMANEALAAARTWAERMNLPPYTMDQPMLSGIASGRAIWLDT
jgi:hypothetical protein